MHAFISWWLDTTVGPFSAADIAGFVTGALCVWLVVRQHVANFPIGILNNLFFLMLFVDVRLYADAGLQIVYLGLGVVGWFWWLRGGVDRGELTVTRTTRREVLGCIAGFVVGYAVLVPILEHNGGAFPPLDAATTMASLVAQHLLNRKRLENWWVWIAVDVIYVPLYLHRGLPLTALLYLGFIGLCIQGARTWRRALDDHEQAETAPVPVVGPGAPAAVLDPRVQR